MLGRVQYKMGWVEYRLEGKATEWKRASCNSIEKKNQCRRGPSGEKASPSTEMREKVIHLIAGQAGR